MDKQAKVKIGGIGWQGEEDKHDESQSGSGNGHRSGDHNPDIPRGVVPYDIEFERKEAQKYTPLPPAKVQKQEKSSPPSMMAVMSFKENNGTGTSVQTRVTDIPQHFQPYDYDFEKKCAQESEPTGTGHFYSRLWMQLGEDLVDVATERPLLLFTQQLGNAPGKKCSMGHENHPFVAMVHLLKEADVGSTVYMSMPYVSDKQVMDELCHFAQPQGNGGRDLNINIILCETKDNKDFINQDFLAGRNDILDACQRLNIRSTPMYPGFCHSKAMVSTAGSMVGSYNYTYAARQYNHEHGVLLGPGHSSQILQQQLKARFENASPIVYRSFTEQE